MYIRDSEQQQEHQRSYVEEALFNYMTYGHSTTAGFDILRYAERGLIEAKPEVNANEFLEWYPLHQGHTILRLALKGLLQYKKQNL